jgi:hypothetical protein
MSTTTPITGYDEELAKVYASLSIETRRRRTQKAHPRPFRDSPLFTENTVSLTERNVVIYKRPQLLTASFHKVQASDSLLTLDTDSETRDSSPLDPIVEEIGLEIDEIFKHCEKPSQTEMIEEDVEKEYLREIAQQSDQKRLVLSWKQKN